MSLGAVWCRPVLLVLMLDHTALEPAFVNQADTCLFCELDLFERTFYEKGSRNAAEEWTLEDTQPLPNHVFDGYQLLKCSEPWLP